MLASDLDNPDFVGAKDPDSILQVEFYDHAALDTWATNESGIKKYKTECPYIRITIPGNQNLTVERPADDLDMQKYPKQWLYYQMQTGKIPTEANNSGWKLSEWEELDKDTLSRLNYMRFYTLEQLAAANEVQIQTLGIAGSALRDAARKALKAKYTSEMSKDLAERDEKIAKQSAEVSELKSQMAQLMQMMQGMHQNAVVQPVAQSQDIDAADFESQQTLQQPQIEKPLPKRRGRPPKAKA